MSYEVDRNLNDDDSLDKDGYFECQYVNEQGEQCKNTTFTETEVYKLASYKTLDHYVKEIVDVAVQCTRCEHVQTIGMDRNTVTYAKFRKPKR